MDCLGKVADLMDGSLSELTTDVDFFAQYLHYCEGTEVPPWFNRWSMIVGLGAWLGRRCYFQFGDKRIYPNIYAILVGMPGTKKSTAIKRVKQLLIDAGYETFAAEKTSKEKFLLDMAGTDDQGKAEVLDLSSPFGDDEDKESFICADEFNDFFGNNILEFAAMLGVLWDYSGPYKNRIKNGTSIVINNPTISILGGTTEVTFANTFPPEVIGQGFFSRVLAIYCPPTGIKVPWPKRSSEEERARILLRLSEIRLTAAGEITISDSARALVSKIYMTWKPFKDYKFAQYGNRRQDQLIKLMMLHAVVRGSQEIEPQDVTYANTILMHTEHFMPLAFAAFGSAKNSMLVFIVLQVIQNSNGLTFDELWKQIQGNAGSIDDMHEVILGLLQAERIQVIEKLLLPKRIPIDLEQANEIVDYRFLTDAEKSNV